MCAAALEALLGWIDEAAFEFDAAGTCVNVCSHNETLLIGPRENLLGRRVDDVFGGGEAQRFLEIIRRVLASGETERLEFRQPSHAGGRWFSARIGPIRSADGSCRTVSCLIREITERKRSEQFLAAQYEVTRILAETEKLETAAPDLLRAVATNMQWDWGALWNIAPESN